MKTSLLFARSALALAAHRTVDHALMAEPNRTAAIDQFGNQRGLSLGQAWRTHDHRTVDSTGAFLVGELERLDQTLNMPLASVTWSRDIPLREDVSVADDASSFTLSTFASAGGAGTGHGIRTGKAWIGRNTDQIGGVSVDIGKFPQPLTPWALEIKYSLMEMESAIRAGRPIDAQKYEALKLKHQMDVDEMAYAGDAGIFINGAAAGGLVNSAAVTNVTNLPNGAAVATPRWATKTPDEILADVNNMITSNWGASAWAVMPNRILLPPTQFGYISTAKVSNAGNVSILKYVMENNVLTASGKGQLEFAPCKWLVGAGTGGTLGTEGGVDRMLCYTKDSKYVRYPMTLLDRTPVQYDSLYQKTTYYCKLGVLEIPYPETINYRDGL